MGAVQGDDLWTMGPRAGTRTGAQERHHKPAFFNRDVSDGPGVLFAQCLEQAGELVEGSVFFVTRLFGFRNGLRCSARLDFNSMLLAQGVDKVSWTETSSLGKQLFGLLGDPRTLDIGPIERSTGVPLEPSHAEKAIAALVDMVGEVTLLFGALEIHPLRDAF